MAPDVSIIIVNWNACDYLRDCIRSIVIAAGPITFEIIVVDNNSQDASVAMVRREFPTITLIVNSENRGFAAANNQGLRIATGRYLLLLNPDTIILDEAIALEMSKKELERWKSLLLYPKNIMRPLGLPLRFVKRLLPS